ncbi:MAG: hypothetical protein WCT23_06165 [Candidatus Neomarinimicrobiota bacterium]|jgi:hypothetical protein
MKAKFIFLFIAMSAFLLALPNKQLSQEHIHVFFAEKDRRIAEISLNTVQKQHETLGLKYDLDINPLFVYIADSENSYRRLAGSSSALWSMGLASGDKLLVKSPSFSRQSFNDFQKTLLHETAHLSVSDTPLPVWFNEGFAQYHSGQYDLRKRILVSRAFIGKNIIPLSHIEYLMQMKQDKAEIAYAQSVAMFSYLVEYFGEGLVGKCVQLSKEYQDFDRAFSAAFLMSPEHFMQVWQRNTESSFRPYIFLDQHNLIWILAPIMLVIGFILMKYRSKKLLAKWEAEEIENEEDIS